MALRNLHSKQHKVDEEALKQQELLYIQDLQLQQLEHKYNRMEGERTDDELIVLNNKIKVHVQYMYDEFSYFIINIFHVVCVYKVKVHVHVSF